MVKNSQVSFNENNTPIADNFGDIYFSKDNGLAETKHVFLDGNGLPDAWQDYEHIRICETGFGTGLNFLSTAKLFEETAQSGQKLFFTSIEKYPLKKEDIERSLQHWKDYFGDLYTAYINNYPIEIDGFHPIMIKPNIFLVLIFEDVKDALLELRDKQDFWFLDGFAPAQNPDMWEQALFDNMARLSHEQTRFATFTSAGFVKRGLQQVGFHVKKVAGYGRKREMLTGHFTTNGPRPLATRKSQEITICGAGLAGSCLAWFLKSIGQDVVLVDKDLSLDNASTNACGLVNIRIGAERIPAFDYWNNAFALFLRHVPKHLFQQIGAIHSPDNHTKEKRFQKFMQDIAWPRSLVEPCNDGLFFPKVGLSSPKDLRDYYLENFDVKHGTDGDILATSFDTNFSALPLQKIRGQVSYGKSPNHGIKHLHVYGHYHAPLDKDTLVFGATFEHWIDHKHVTEEDHQKNLDHLHIDSPIKITDGWAGFRCASKDRLPIIGKYNGKYLSIAHGAHGMISTLAASYIIAYELGLIPQPFSSKVLEAVSPARYDKI